jgi:hypothetical protein
MEGNGDDLFKDLSHNFYNDQFFGLLTVVKFSI